MPRTTSDAVIAILGNNYDTDGVVLVAPHIETASSIVDSLVSEATITVAGPRLELIERWLSAHFYAHADQIYKYKQVGNSAASFQGTTGMGFSSTNYGQTALSLDPTGYLAKISALAEDSEHGSGRRVGTIAWLGTNP